MNVNSARGSTWSLSGSRSKGICAALAIIFLAPLAGIRAQSQDDAGDSRGKLFPAGLPVGEGTGAILLTQGSVCERGRPLMRDQQVVHIIGVFFLHRQNRFQHFLGGRV